MTPAERWVESTPTEMFNMPLHVERGPMVLDDVRALPDSPLVLADGSVIPPHAVSSGIADGSRALWLIPTPKFQRALLDLRKDRGVASCGSPVSRDARAGRLARPALAITF